ncbi:MAG: dihydropteroate synthase [Acidobacteriota bacterium]
MFSKRLIYTLRLPGRNLELGRRTLLFAVINVTPDSFYDGGRYDSPGAGVEHALRLVEQGADVLDIGGESSRPGAQSVSAQVEIDRVLPVVEGIRRHSDIPLSIDTTKLEVARACLAAGADLINDISAFRFEPELAVEIATTGAAVILMHSRGTPHTMQQLPPSPDILSDVTRTLAAAVAQAFQSGISRDRILIDPGVGFGKTAQDNLKILQRLSLLSRFELPVLVGTSRKSFIGKILDLPLEERLWGTAATVAAAVLGGAHAVRVHDVVENRQVCRIVDAILEQDE